jgi:hypothetical protein
MRSFGGEWLTNGVAVTAWRGRWSHRVGLAFRQTPTRCADPSYDPSVKATMQCFNLSAFPQPPHHGFITNRLISCRRRIASKCSAPDPAASASNPTTGSFCAHPVHELATASPPTAPASVSFIIVSPLAALLRCSLWTSSRSFHVDQTLAHLQTSWPAGLARQTPLWMSK